MGDGGLPDDMFEDRFGEPMDSDGMEREVLRRFGETRIESKLGAAGRLEVL
jgi:hypothetical protein